jgi:CheY-like chemotaxis protein
MSNGDHSIESLMRCGGHRLLIEYNMRSINPAEHDLERSHELKIVRPKIAVIDDERQWLKTFQRIFRNSNYKVDTYSDPQAFLDTIAQHPDQYCGIICDIKMPHVDGHQVFKALKENRATRNIPFLMVSGVLTQDHNLNKVQGLAFISKLDDNLREKVFDELIEVIENWPKVKRYLQLQNVSDEKIEFLCQFFINYHRYFNEILKYVNAMEVACVSGDQQTISLLSHQCQRYMENLQENCMELISLIQEMPQITSFVRKVCKRGRTSLNMVQNFQFMLGENPASNQTFQAFLAECHETLEKIITGTESGYNLRSAEN